MTEVKLFDSIQEAKKILEERSPRLVRIDGINICIIRKGDDLVAFHNQCPHMGEQLHHGVVNYLDEIVCPLHGYRFSLSGGDESSQKCGPIRFVGVDINPDGIFLIM